MQQLPPALLAAIQQQAQHGPPQGMIPHPGMPGMPPGAGGPPGMPMGGAPPGMPGMPQLPPGAPPPGMGMGGMDPMMMQMASQDQRSFFLVSAIHNLQAYLAFSPIDEKREQAAQYMQGMQMLLHGENPSSEFVHGPVTMPAPPPPADGMDETTGQPGIPGGPGYQPGPDVMPQGLEAETLPPIHPLS